MLMYPFTDDLMLMRDNDGDDDEMPCLRAYAWSGDLNPQHSMRMMMMLMRINDDGDDVDK